MRVVGSRDLKWEQRDGCATTGNWSLEEQYGGEGLAFP